jgi:hypothetical protein
VIALRGALHGFDNNCLSTFRGFLQLENVSYGIEPLESSARFEHIVYQVKSDSSMLAGNDSHVWQIDQLDKGHFNEQVTGRVLVISNTGKPFPSFSSHEGGLVS